MSDEAQLEKLAKQIKVCTKCELHRSRTNAVPGEGPTHAEIMLIGEGPGAREDEQGRPFVGASGKFLDQLLEQAGVAVLSGTAFGEYGEGYLRLSYANSIPNIEKALGRIESLARTLVG